MIRLTGRIPDAVIAGLSTTTEPGLAKAWWGYVVATGTFHAAGADGVPTLDLTDMLLKQG